MSVLTMSLRTMMLFGILAVGCGSTHDATPTPAAAGDVDSGAAAVSVDAPLSTPVIVLDDTEDRVTITESRPGAVIHYTTDGSHASATSPIYTAPFYVHCLSVQAGVINAVAIDPEKGASDTASEQYIPHMIGYGVVFSPAQTHFTGSGLITLTCPDAKGIYYTLDGTPPTPASTLYTGPVTIDHTLKMEVMAIMPDVCGGPDFESSVSLELYTVTN